jgi:hypothetical protein
MEGGRQTEVSKAILSRKDVPYVVAAPLLIQDLASWSDQGIQGLQVRQQRAVESVPLIASGNYFQQQTSSLCNQHT